MPDETSQLPGVPTREVAAAEDLLRRFGPRAARRGTPYFLKVRWPAGDRRPDVSVVERAQGLLGITVTARWEGAAVVATGRFHPLEEGHEPSALVRSGMRGGLTLACVVSRQGNIGWRLLLPDGSPFDPVPDEGFTLDVLRRSLQLPTPPPAVTTSALLLAVWVGAICDAGEGTADCFGWDEVLYFHPALADEPPMWTLQAEEVVRRAPAKARWEAMRLLVAAGMTSPDLPSPRLARWMDEGMFARWVLGSLPPASDIVAAARPHLDPAAWHRLRHLAHEVDDRICAH